jgi:hypothetical protein
MVTLSESARIEFPGPMSDDRAGDRQHLGIDGTVGLAELWDPNLLGGAQRNEHHPGPSRRLIVRRPIPPTPASAIAAPITRIVSNAICPSG